MLTSLLIFGLFQTAGGTSPQARLEKPTVELVVMLAAPVYQPDGGVTAETVALPATGAGLVHLFGRKSVCDPATAGAAEPTDAGYGWRVASQVISRSDKDVVISIDWRRMWDGGKKIPKGPGGTVQLTLHPGDRIPLDQISNSSPRHDCRAVGLGLEVRLSRAVASFTARKALLPLGATPGGARPVDAELWLLHALPSGVEQITHQKVRIPAAGGRFTFVPTSIATSRGDMTVELTGFIDRYRSPTGSEFLLLSLTRTIRGDGLPTEGVPGTTSTVMPLPAPNEVLSIEMPRGGGGRGGGGGGTRVGGNARGAAPPPDPAGAGAAVGMGVQGARRGGAVLPNAAGQALALLDGHQFALRMKITPVSVN
jgi:hypothetical protein